MNKNLKTLTNGIITENLAVHIDRKRIEDQNNDLHKNHYDPDLSVITVGWQGGLLL